MWRNDEEVEHDDMELLGGNADNRDPNNKRHRYTQQ